MCRELTIVAAVVRKILLSAAICVAGVEAHLRWGSEYDGTDKYQVSLLVVVTIVAEFCAAFFLLCSGIAAWLLRHKSWLVHWATDVVLFAAWCGLAVWVAVTAMVE